MPLPAWIPEELEKISHREYSTGFYMGGEPGQETHSGGYVRSYEVVAVCEGRRADGMTVLSQRNRFFRGDTADVLEPGKEPYTVSLDAILRRRGNTHRGGSSRYHARAAENGNAHRAGSSFAESPERTGRIKKRHTRREFSPKELFTLFPWKWRNPKWKAVFLLLFFQ